MVTELQTGIGPVVGGFIAEYTTWRWVFWAPSIADIVVQCLGLLYLQETYAPKLLKAKAAKLRKETGNSQLTAEYDRHDKSFVNTMKRSLMRPFILLGTQPIVQILALYMAYLYGIYCTYSSTPVLSSYINAQYLQISYSRLFL